MTTTLAEEVVLAEEEVKTNSTVLKRKSMFLKYCIRPHLAYNFIKVCNDLSV